MRCGSGFVEKGVVVARTQSAASYRLRFIAVLRKLINIFAIASVKKVAMATYLKEVSRTEESVFKIASTIKVLNVNANSLKKRNKEGTFNAKLQERKPDVVIVTETKLKPSDPTPEIIPDETAYATYRKDRNQHGGGVLVLVSKQYESSRETLYETDCEIIWVRLEISESDPVYIAAYYRPDVRASLSEFKRSLELVKKSNSNGHLWILGDFNFPKFNWNEDNPTMEKGCTPKKEYINFLKILNDYNFTQLVKEPTRKDNVLDLFLISNPSNINVKTKVEVIPGISDHNIVFSEVTFSKAKNHSYSTTASKST